jgi:hypothetical protein
MNGGTLAAFADIDPLDIWIMAVPLVIYAVAFLSLYAASKIRERKWEASRQKRLDKVCGRPRV